MSDYNAMIEGSVACDEAKIVGLVNAELAENIPAVE
jgi:hypothetical protein